jgi:anti-anti-sigma factor
MTYTSTSNNFVVTDLDSIQLIHMPSQFTSTEANYFKQLLQQFSFSFEQVPVASSNLTIKKIVVNFEKTVFIDNGGLIGLCQILRFAKDTKIDLRFLSFSPQVKMVLSLVGLEHFFSIENSIDSSNTANLHQQNTF